MPLLAPRSAGVRHAMETASLLPGTREGDWPAAGTAACGDRNGRRPATGHRPARPRTCRAAAAGCCAGTFVRPSVLLAVGPGRAGVARRPRAARRRPADGRRAAAGARRRQRPVADLHLDLAPGRARQRHLGAALPRGAGRAGRVLFGSAERAVDLVLLAAVPLAGTTAYFALRRLVRSVPLRIWGAVSYALLPPLLGAVATGRLGTAVLAVLLPLVVLTLVRAFGLDGRRAELAGLLGGRPAASPSRPPSCR